jgi:Cu+-exporting ATPase
MKIMATLVKPVCYHCGEDTFTGSYQHHDKLFCCSGCLNVYQILSASNLGSYYKLNNHPGKTQVSNTQFSYLEEAEIKAKLIDYTDSHKTIITLYIPAIHCSSCIWLLEHLHTLHKGILENRVDFLKKQVYIQFNHHQLSLKELAELLQSIGYEPLISLQDVVKEQKKIKDRLPSKIAVAGFCFGNSMLLSFPSYFGLSNGDSEFGYFFGLLNLLFCFPVVFYSGRDFFSRAYKDLKNGVLSLDFPLALGIAVLFLRTFVECAFAIGDGFADSLTGLVFFLLIGRYVQQKTYYHLSFERDYRSFFPVSVKVVNSDGQETDVPLEKLKEGDRIRVKNQEIIPADAILLQGEAMVDFSFVTGESIPVSKTLGEIIYAGGRQLGGFLELEVVKPVSQSYLTQLWNNEAFKKHSSTRIKTFVSKVSHYFSIILLIIAFGALLYWIPQDWQRGVAAFTAVLIIACPCALALSTPFTMSAALSIFDKNKFYLKNTEAVEQLAAIDTIVFDKTGTITLTEQDGVTFKGNLNPELKNIIYSLCKNSSHPHSRKICDYLQGSTAIPLINYTEEPGKGIQAVYQQQNIRLGSRLYITGEKQNNNTYSEVHISIGKEYAGYFTIKQKLRTGLKELLSDLGTNYDTHLLSGDASHDAEKLTPYFKHSNTLHFKQSPQDKLNFIHNLQLKGNKVMMIGDGLNDSGALKQSNAGIAITDHINNFTPGSDAILDAKSLPLLPRFMRFSKSAVKVIHCSFVISSAYNIFGLSYAVTGNLSPLFAAILMPLSTVTIISFTSLATHYAAKKLNLL